MNRPIDLPIGFDDERTRYAVRAGYRAIPETFLLLAAEAFDMWYAAAKTARMQSKVERIAEMFVIGTITIEDAIEMMNDDTF